MSSHKDLNGVNLHNSRMNLVHGDPNTLHTPSTFSGECVVDVDHDAFYISEVVATSSGYNVTWVSLVSSSSYLATLLDVNIYGILDKQIIKYNSSTGKFLPSDDLTATELSDLTDVSLVGLQNNNILRYSSSTGKFHPSTDVNALANLIDVHIPGIQDNEIIRYNSSTGKFIRSTDSTSLANLTDVDITGIQNSEMLMYHSSTGKFIPSDYINQDLKTTASPTFAGLKLDNSNGILYTSCGIVYEYQHLPIASGPMTDPILVDHNDGTATINSVQVHLFSSTNFSDMLRMYTVSGQTFSFTEGIECYIVADYNNGNPIMRLETDKTLINGSNIVTLLVCWRQGTTIHSVSEDAYAMGLANKINRYIYNTEQYRRSIDGGLILSETSIPVERTVTVSYSVVYAGILPIPVNQFNSSSSTGLLTQVYHVGGVWTYTNYNQYDNEYYDNGTDLASISNNRFATRWFFRSIGDVNQVFYVLGSNGSYTSSDAAALEGMPTIPILLRDHCMFVGRIIVKEGASSGSVLSAFGIITSLSTVINHNDTNNIQGGIGNEYYHLTNIEHIQATQLATNSQTGLLSSTGYTEFYNKRNNVDNSGIYTLPTLTDHGDGSVTIGDGVYNLYQTTDYSGNIYQYAITGNTFILENNKTNYIMANYNNGIPVITCVTTLPSGHDSSITPVYTIYRDNLELYELDWDESGKGLINKLAYQNSRIHRFEIEPDSLLLSTSTGNSIIIDSGVVWHAGTSTSIPAYDSNINTLDYWYHVGGVWTKTNTMPSTSTGDYVTKWYDDGTDLVEISTDDHCAVNWIYRAVDSDENCAIVVLGSEDYTLSRTQISQPIQNLPSFITKFCVLVGRIIINKGNTITPIIDNINDTLYLSNSFVNTVDALVVSDANRNSTGLISEGLLTYNSVNSFAVAAGSGYVVNKITETAKKITWTEFPSILTVNGNGINYFGIGDDHTYYVGPNIPDMNYYIYVGAAYMSFNNTVNVGFAANPTRIQDYQQNMDIFITGSIRTLIESGLEISEGVTPLTLSMSEGYINTRLTRIHVPLTTSFTKLIYTTNYGWMPNSLFPNVVDNYYWNDITQAYPNQSILMTPGYWKKELVCAMANGQIYVVCGQAEYATQAEALAAPLPTYPPQTGPAVMLLAFICLQRGDVSIQDRISDLRPFLQRVFGYTEKGLGDAIIHSSLLALDQDDHNAIYYNQTISDTKYAILDGKAGGQTLSGSISTGENLHLRGNAVDNLGIDIAANGTVSVNAGSYEALVQYDNILTNKKYVDDVSAALIQKSTDIDSTGLVSGGLIVLTGGITFKIEAGIGYINWNGVLTRVTWSDITDLQTVVNGENFVCIQTNPAGEGSAYISSAQAPTGQYIELGYLFSGAANTTIIELISTPKYTSKLAERTNTYVIEGLRAIVEDGTTVSEQATPNELQLNIAAGTIHVNLQKILLDGTTTFNKIYNTANYGFVPLSTSSGYVEIHRWNNVTKNYGAALIEMTDTYWKKDLMFRVPNGHVYYILGQTEYADEATAKAAPLPTVPSNFSRVLVYLCTIVSQKNTASIGAGITDIRPYLPRIFGFGSTASGITLSHSALSNLDFASSGHTGFEPTFNHGNFNIGSDKLSISGTSTGAVIGSGLTIDVIEGNITHNNLGGVNGGSPYYHSDQSINKADSPEYADDLITGLGVDSVLGNTNKSVKDYITKAWTYNKNVLLDTTSPMGFVNRTSSTINFNVGTRALSIYGTFSFYILGIKYNKVLDIGTPDTVAIPTNTTGKYGFYYVTSTGTAVIKSTAKDTYFNYNTDTPIAVVYYNNSSASSPWAGPSALVLDRRHGIGMNSGTRKLVHDSIGTVVSGTGFDLNGTYSVATGIGGLAANSYGVDAGHIVDEDMDFTISILSDNAGSGNQYPIFYKIGTEEWRWYKNILPYHFGTNITYNLNFGGTFSLAELTVDDTYVNYYLCAINAADVNSDYRFIWVMGQHEFTSLAAAQEKTFLDLDLTYLPFYSVAPLWQVTMRRNASYTAITGYVRIEATTNIIGTFASIAPTFNIQQHNTLAGRTASNVHPSESISYDNTSTGLAATNVKAAIDKIANNYQVTSAMTNYQPVASMTNYQATSAMFNYVNTSVSSQFQQTTNMSNYQLVANSSLSLGTGAAASFQYTSANSNFVQASVSSNFQLVANSSLSLGTGAAASFVYTSASSNYQLLANSSLSLGTGAAASFVYTSASSLFQATSAMSNYQLLANSSLSLGTGAAASFVYTSASSNFQLLANSSLSQATSLMSNYQLLANSSLSLGTGASASFIQTANASLYALTANDSLSLGTGAAASFQYTSANTKFHQAWELVGAQTAGTVSSGGESKFYLSAGNMMTLSGNSNTIIFSMNSASLLGTGATASFMQTANASNYQLVANSSNSLGTGASASFIQTANASLYQLVVNSTNSLGTGASASFMQTANASLYQLVANSSNSLGTGATASFQYTSAMGNYVATSSIGNYFLTANSTNLMNTTERANYYDTAGHTFADRTHIHGVFTGINISATSASNGLQLSVANSGGAVNLSHWEPYILLTATSVSSFANASFIFNTFNLLNNVAMIEVNLVKSFNMGLASRTSVNSAGSNGWSITQGITLFKRSGYDATGSSVLSMITTASGGMSFSHTYSSITNQALKVSYVTNSTGGTTSWSTQSASNAFTSYWTGLKYFPVPLVTTLTPGEYWIAYGKTTGSNALNSTITNQMLMSDLQINNPIITLGSIGFAGTTDAQMNGYGPAKYGHGYASAITTNAAMNLTNISTNASSNFPYFVMMGW